MHDVLFTRNIKLEDINFIKVQQTALTMAKPLESDTQEIQVGTFLLILALCQFPTLNFFCRLYI